MRRGHHLLKPFYYGCGGLRCQCLEIDFMNTGYAAHLDDNLLGDSVLEESDVDILTKINVILLALAPSPPLPYNDATWKINSYKQRCAAQMSLQQDVSSILSARAVNPPYETATI